MENEMRYWKRTVVILFIGIFAGLIIAANFGIFGASNAENLKIPKESIDILSRTDQAMADIVHAVKPCVVNISSQRTMTIAPFSSPFFEDPLFHDFFGESQRNSGKPRKYKQKGLGSGVIVGKEGYIITNNHVVQDSEEITVKLSDKRQFKGKVIGADPRTDLAVVKISAGNLPFISLGDSDKLRVGERVIAIGNPFGLNQTVTSGIISAIGRADVGIADYEDFIQTDAAINPGNSGGALVNIRGELIGVNTAIATTSGGYQGVGFAIPSNMVRVVMESLIKKGKVVRGWFGMSIQPLTPELARQFELKSEKGVLVSDVVDDGPAQKAGIQQGDIILTYNGKEIEDVSQFRNMVAGGKPGTEVNIKLLREGKEKSLRVIIGEAPAKQSTTTDETNSMFIGINVQSLSSKQRMALGIPTQIKGVIVTSVDDDSEAAGILQTNDIIMEVNKKKTSNIDEYKAAIGSIKDDEEILMLIYRDGASLYITLLSR